MVDRDRVIVYGFKKYKSPLTVNQQPTTSCMIVQLCINLIYPSHSFVAFARSLHRRDPKPTGEIHHSLGIIRRSELFQFRQITAVEFLHSRRFRKRRVDEVREIFRQGTFFKDLDPEFVQGCLHGFDPVCVVALALPGEIYNDGAVRLAFLMRPGRVCRMVKHGLGERPQPDGDTGATVLFESFGSILKHLGYMVNTGWVRGCGIYLRSLASGSHR